MSKCQVHVLIGADLGVRMGGCKDVWLSDE